MSRLKAEQRGPLAVIERMRPGGALEAVATSADDFAQTMMDC